MTLPPDTRPQAEISFPKLIGSAIGVKLLVDTGVQIVNPFFEMIAVGLGTNVVVMGSLVALRSAMGLLSPLLGSLADRHGFRPIMRMALLASALGMLIVGLSNSIWTAALGMAFCGLGFHSFTPTLHAYLGARLPYTIRARGMGMVEYSWALTGIVGLFLIGLLIEAADWRAPFYVLSLLLALAAGAIGTLPTGRPGMTRRPRSGRIDWSWRQIPDFFVLGAHARSAYAVMLAGALNYFAAMQIMIIYGAWLGRSYGLGAAQLGTVALIFGLFDLAASVSVSLFTDRLGKRRSVLYGLSAVTVGYLLMPFLDVGLTAAVAVIALTRSCFEFSIVSNFPLLSEQIPAQRGKVMTLGAAAGMLGGTVASFSAPLLFTTTGVYGLAAVSAAAAFLALVVLLVWVQEEPLAA